MEEKITKNLIIVTGLIFVAVLIGGFAQRTPMQHTDLNGDKFPYAIKSDNGTEYYSNVPSGTHVPGVTITEGNYVSGGASSTVSTTMEDWINCLDRLQGATVGVFVNCK